MPLTIFCAVLLAAFLHVLWNAMLRHEKDKNTIMMMIVFVQALVGMPVVFFYPVPTGSIWWWIVASAVTHFVYQVFLSRSYQYGDLSRVYPIARGGAPMMVLIFSLLFMDEQISTIELFSVIGIGIGIALISFGAWQTKETLRLIPLALCAAFATASYSILDGIGARMMGNAPLYLAWLLIIDAGLSVIYCHYFTKGGLSAFNTRALRMGAIGGALSYAAYAIVLWAMTQAPIPLVTALREVSVMLAVLVGVFWFKEKLDTTKVLAIILITTAVIMTRLF